jgi:hypothetical protein
VVVVEYNCDDQEGDVLTRMNEYKVDGLPSIYFSRDGASPVLMKTSPTKDNILAFVQSNMSE